uniref:DICT domain-containing protein n=1 Tax=Macrostomum lignano TaxID=282301 RepID=A0A1I8GNE3_9PLAT
MDADDAYLGQANYLVDQAIDFAVQQLAEVTDNAVEGVATVPGLSREASAIKKRGGTYLSQYPEQPVPDIDWLRIGEFSVDRAEAKIEQFIRETWEFDASWLFCIDYLGEDAAEFDNRHRFRVRWSVPTRRKPDHLVDVFYVFETNRLVHRPGETRFRVAIRLSKLVNRSGQIGGEGGPSGRVESDFPRNFHLDGVDLSGGQRAVPFDNVAAAEIVAAVRTEALGSGQQAAGGGRVSAAAAPQATDAAASE